MIMILNVAVGPMLDYGSYCRSVHNDMFAQHFESFVKLYIRITQTLREPRLTLDFLACEMS